ncbi:MAG TPA: asparagine synthase-related protein [Actinomycetota bacterium]|nr:asparagine synthase-related protein [Actinomycetota bacterium]
MSTLPPLANLFCFWDEDPALRRAVHSVLLGSYPHEQVFAEREWVGVQIDLPALTPTPLLPKGFRFAEGADVAVPQLEEPFDAKKVTTMDGDFGFVHLGERGCAVCVRSCGGLVPFFHEVRPGRTAISTSLDLMAKFRPEEPEADEFVYAIWSTGFGAFPWHRSFLKGVSALAPAHLVGVTEGKAEVSCYWDPRPHKLEKPSRVHLYECGEQLRTLLIANLERDLHPTGLNLLTLSGGIDSSSLAHLARNVAGVRVASLSLIPPGEGPDLDLALSFLDPQVESLGICPSWKYPLGFKERKEYLTRAPHHVIPVIHPALCVLPETNRESKVDVVFGGEVADSICGAPLTLPDWVRAVSPFKLITWLPRLPFGERDALKWLKWRVAWMRGHPVLPYPEALPPFFDESLKGEYRHWRRDQEISLKADRRPKSYLGLDLSQDVWLAMNWETTSALGIRRSTPFVSRAMIQLGYAAHPEEQFMLGTKSVIKAGLKDDVPPIYLWRNDKGTWGRPSIAAAKGGAALRQVLQREVREVSAAMIEAAGRGLTSVREDRLKGWRFAVEARTIR